MKMTWVILAGTLVCLTLGVIVWLGGDALRPGRSVAQSPLAELDRPLRIGLIPERDIFQQRRRYQALADYLADEMDRPVELVTNNTYQGVLTDFQADRVDVAFLGSFVAVLAMDRHDARVLVKPESSQNISTYRGVIFTRAGSPVESIEDLAGCSIAMVKATTAGDLFPVSMMAQHGMFESGEPVEMRWVGTHDMAIQEVVAGRTNVAAAKDLRLDAYEAAHPVVQLRRLATSESVPSNALLVHASVDETLARRLADILLEMDQHPHGRATLEAFGAQRFVTCSADEYDAIYDMIDVLGENWSRLGVDGPPPRRPGPAVTRGGY